LDGAVHIGQDLLFLCGIGGGKVFSGLHVAGIEEVEECPVLLIAIDCRKISSML